MTVKDTLYSSLIRYSVLYENKWQVFHHLFSSYGNGYQWVDGELVEMIPSKCRYENNGCIKTIIPTLAKLGIKKRDIPERVKKEAEDFTPIFYTWFPYRLESDRKKYAEDTYTTYLKMIDIINQKEDNVPKQIMTKEQYIDKCVKAIPEKRPLSIDNNYSFEDYLKDTQSLDFSYVYNYPEDIKPDWAEARQEWENFLKSVGWWLKD